MLSLHMCQMEALYILCSQFIIIIRMADWELQVEQLNLEIFTFYSKNSFFWWIFSKLRMNDENDFLMQRASTLWSLEIIQPRPFVYFSILILFKIAPCFRHKINSWFFDKKCFINATGVVPFFGRKNQVNCTISIVIIYRK